MIPKLDPEDQTQINDDDRIPFANENPYDSETMPRKDVIYQVTRPDGSVIRKYVRVTEVYGDKGVALCRVVRSYDENANPLESDEELTVDFERLIKPDVFPELAQNISRWIECSAMTKGEVKSYVDTLIDGYFNMQVTAFDMSSDIDRTIKAIKKLLFGKIGGFFLTILLGYISKKLHKAIDDKLGKKDQKEHFNRKLSEMRTMYSHKGPQAQTEEDEKTQKIEQLQKKLKEVEKKPVINPKAQPVQKKPVINNPKAK